MAKRIYIYLAMLLGFCFSAKASQPDSVCVSLVTIYPGSEIYELYGHTELRVTDEHGDYFFNYGLFDFNAPGFVYRFVKGETDYLCGAIPAAYALQGYDGRRVVEQRLNLTQTQARKVRDMLYENARPENATYRYKFVSDNCATRPRDIIERALGDSLMYRPNRQTDKPTYRNMMHRYNANYSWSRFGIDLALGCNLDTAITYRQQMFAPVVLMEAISGAMVKCPDGRMAPLVSATNCHVDGDEQGALLPPTPWYATPLFVALVLLALVVAASVADCRRRKVSRWLDTLIFVAYGLCGCVIFFLVFVSTHECTSPNFNALWLHPIYFALAVLPWVPKAKKILFALHGINCVWLFASALLLGAGVLRQELLLSFYVLMAVPMVRSLSYIFVNRLCSRETAR